MDLRLINNFSSETVFEMTKLEYQKTIRGQSDLMPGIGVGCNGRRYENIYQEMTEAWIFCLSHWLAYETFLKNKRIIFIWEIRIVRRKIKVIRDGMNPENSWLIVCFKSSRPEMFFKKVVLRTLTKFTGKHLCLILFFDNDAGLGPATF